MPLRCGLISMAAPNENTSASAAGPGLAFVYAATIFTSAFLLFQIQPMISKAILPWFGGTPAVWTVCLLFFQSLLFAGYAYAHFTNAWLRPRGPNHLPSQDPTEGGDRRSTLTPPWAKNSSTSMP